MLGSWVSVPVGDRNMQSYIVGPQSEGPFPAVIVGMYGFGVDEFIRGVCDRLANSGYVAIAPDLYYRDSDEDLNLIRTMSMDDPRRIPMVLNKIDRLRDTEIAEDMRRLASYIHTLPNVDETRIGIAGFCIGGRIAYMTAALDPRFGAVSLFYSFGMDDSWGPGPSPLSLTPNIICPVIGFFGAEDTNPTRADVDELDRSLIDSRKTHEFHIYEGVGHAFMESTNHRRYDQTACNDAWDKFLGFLSKELGPR